MRRALPLSLSVQRRHCCPSTLGDQHSLRARHVPPPTPVRPESAARDGKEEEEYPAPDSDLSQLLTGPIARVPKIERETHRHSRKRHRGRERRRRRVRRPRRRSKKGASPDKREREIEKGGCCEKAIAKAATRRRASDCPLAWWQGRGRRPTDLRSPFGAGFWLDPLDSGATVRSHRA